MIFHLKMKDSTFLFFAIIVVKKILNNSMVDKILKTPRISYLKIYDHIIQFVGSKEMSFVKWKKKAVPTMEQPSCFAFNNQRASCLHSLCSSQKEFECKF